MCRFAERAVCKVESGSPEYERWFLRSDSYVKRARLAYDELTAKYCSPILIGSVRTAMANMRYIVAARQRIAHYIYKQALPAQSRSFSDLCAVASAIIEVARDPTDLQHCAVNVRLFDLLVMNEHEQAVYALFDRWQHTLNRPP